MVINVWEDLILLVLKMMLRDLAYKLKHWTGKRWRRKDAMLCQQHVLQNWPTNWNIGPEIGGAAKMLCSGQVSARVKPSKCSPAACLRRKKGRLTRGPPLHHKRTGWVPHCVHQQWRCVHWRIYGVGPLADDDQHPENAHVVSSLKSRSIFDG